MNSKKIAISLVLLFILGGCGVKTNADSSQDMVSESGKPTYQKISAEKAKEMMDSQTVTIVDVRTKEEYGEGHIENAVLIPLDTILKSAEDDLKDKDAVLLVYCRSGRRSAEAAETLSTLGYSNVYDFGGINDWPYDVVTN